MAFPVPTRVIFVSEMRDGRCVSTIQDQRGLFNTAVFDLNNSTIGDPETDVIFSDALRTHARMLDDMCESEPDSESAKRSVWPAAQL